MKRDDLRQYFKDNDPRTTLNDEQFIDFILAREKEQISKVVEPLRNHLNNNAKTFGEGRQQAINEALSIADSILRGEV